MTKHVVTRWGNPRRSIANKFEENDLGYATAGILGALNVYIQLNLQPSVTKTMTILDYGCGTGRMARVFTPLFKGVFGYDPTPECIEEAKKETLNCDLPFGNLKFSNNLAEIPRCDVGCCISVIEHLSPHDSAMLIQNLRKKVKGPIGITYSVEKNAKVIQPYLTKDQIQQDIGNNIQFRLIDFTIPVKK